MPSSRQEHTAVLRTTSYVLVCGGNNINSTSTTVLASCATYNPATGIWTAVSSLNDSRVDHSATLVHNGHVLVAGGDNANNELSSAELY